MKAASDKNDIEFLIRWLSTHQMKISFKDYLGKPKDDLLGFVRIFWEQKLIDGGLEVIEILKGVLENEDRQEILAGMEGEESPADV